jgi:hypothetical protein
MCYFLFLEKKKVTKENSRPIRYGKMHLNENSSGELAVGTVIRFENFRQQTPLRNYQETQKALCFRLQSFRNVTTADRRKQGAGNFLII